MNWLHPALLGWSALAIAPFLLHWMLRDRIRRITFGGTRFIGNREVVATSRKHWLEALLMLLRAAILVLLVVAFARPFFSSSVGVHPMSIILVDCSRSMQIGNRLTRAQAEAQSVLRSLPGHEDVIIAGVGSSGALSLVPVANSADAQQRIAALHAAGGSANMLGSLELAVARSGTQPCSIHLISALQADGFPSTQRVSQLPANCRLVIHDVAQPSDIPADAIKVTAEMEGSELTPGDGNLIVAARVANRGQARQVTVVLQSGKQELDKHTLDLAQDGTGTVTLRGSLHEVGDIPCVVKVDGVPTILPDDNQCILVANVIKQVHIAVVDGHPDSDHAQDSGFFVAAALKAGGSKRYEVDLLQTIPSLDSYQSVILTSPQHISTINADHLTKFVNAGGGLLILLGPDIDPEQLNPALSKLAPARLRSWRVGDVSLSTESAGASMFSGIIGDHGDNLAVAQFSGAAELSDTAGSQVLLRFSNQNPALIIEQRGHGVSMLFANAFDRRVGDFPLRPLFLPLIREMVRALHIEGSGSSSLKTGANLEEGAGDTLSGPQGPCPFDGDGHLRVSDPGFYHLEHDGSSHLIAVNGDPSASDPLVLQPEDVQRLVTNQSLGVHATSHGLERVLAPDEVRQAEARLGLGHWCLILVGSLLLFELLVAQSVSRR
jgi:hypothetical protein